MSDRHRGGRARTERASIWQIGLTSNPMLLWGIAFEVEFAITLQGNSHICGTALPPPDAVLLLMAIQRVARLRPPVR